MQFKEKCGPGEFSSTGLSPCSPCDKGTYQNMPMSRQCMQCPNGLTTAFLGSTNAHNCTREFDCQYEYILVIILQFHDKVSLS